MGAEDPGVARVSPHLPRTNRAHRLPDDEALAQVKHVLELLLRAYEPFPAYVVDRHWNLVLANDAARRLTGFADVAAAARSSGGNVLRFVLHPDGLRPLVVNWEEAAAALLRRLELEVAHAPGEEELAALLEELRRLPGLSDIDTRPRAPEPDELLVPLHLRAGDLNLRLFTTITTIGAVYDVTLEELRIESLLPADPETEDALRQLLGA